MPMEGNIYVEADVHERRRHIMMSIALTFSLLAATQVEWEPTVDQARVRAASTGDPVLIYVLDSL